ncbi:MAG: VWA domain-containing protein [Acidobacteriota bacterium]|nr:VWA domain-containing protein [Acidobacteriota bacterium]
MTDAKGKPVEGLKQDDFKVMEDGVVQPIHFFDLHKVAPAVGSQPALDLHLPPNTFSNLSLAPADQPVTVLLYDMLNTPQGTLPAAHQALVKFIKEQKSSTKIAIFVLTDRLHMVQGFTDDDTRLLAALDSKAIKAPISQLRVADSSAADSASLLGADPNASAAAGPGAQTAITESQTRPGGADTPIGAGAVLEMLSNAETEENTYLLNQRVKITVNAFTNMARFVSALPGRKNLIWMSGSFPSELLPDSPQNSGGRSEFSTVYLQDDIREAQQVLKDSRVAIYPVDIRGLQADSQFSASAKSPSKISNFGIQQGAEHATMDALAGDTGGRAFYNTNSLQQAMDAAVREGSEYYSLTYAPSNPKEDGAVRHIKVVLTNANYHLYYRREYLADDTSHPAPVQPLVLDMNMQHGAPNSSELFFEAKVNPIGGPMVASSNEVETLKTFLQTKATGKRTKIPTGAENVQHYDINFAVIGRQLQMPPTENGHYATAMRFGLAAYTQDSALLNGMEVSIKNSIPAAQYQKIESQGYHASMLFVVPQEAVSIRLAVRDEIGNRIGTMEIPLPIPVPKSAATAAKTTK